MKIEFTVEFTDDEIKDFLIRSGYKIVQHNFGDEWRFESGAIEIPTGTLELALCEYNMDLVVDNEYNKVFKRIIEDKKKKYLLS